MKKMWFSFLKSENGMSLVEIMMAVGLTGAVTLGVMSIVKIQSDSQSMIEKGMNINDHYFISKNNIRPPNTCMYNFGGITFDKAARNV